MSELVCIERSEGIAHVRLHRPDKHNGMSFPMLDAVLDAARSLRDDRALRAVVLAGDGPSFCAGLDVKAALGSPVRTATGLATLWLPMKNKFQRWSLAWRELGVPVIAAVHGNCFGAGLQLALGADIRIAAPDTVLSVYEINWGLTPDMAGTQLLPRLVGPDVAAELTWTARLVDAAEADRIGLVTRVVDDPLAAAHELAARIAGVNPEAVQTAKRLLEQAHGPMEDGLAAERAAMGKIMGSPNQREAAAAGLEKRKPKFT
jgi:enoyl-CoA hydratase/carnithine racemase